MKKTTILLATLALFACKQSPKNEKNNTSETITEAMEESHYPEQMMKVFEAHGGVQLWKQQRTLSFVLPKPNQPETHTIDLWSRKDRIDMGTNSIGFDGQQVWLLDPDGTYKGDPVFYHNLMFYFYAMPFVFADDGIMYSATEDLEFEGKMYPGLKIAYKTGVGASSNDEYYIHFDPDTQQMAWLGYTVTYRSGEKSDNVRWIRYHDWQRINGVLLPKAITWHKYEGRTILEPQSTVGFEEVSLDTNPKEDSFYAKPSGANFVPLKVQ
ncbi:MAG: hypothetical protein KDD31_03145 [Muricauda sp.]|nr:hypothetical protein [Allomuricauda sp.]